MKKLTASMLFALLLPTGAAAELTIDRVWNEESSGINTLYTLATYTNDTDKTYIQVTVEAIALDSDGNKINMNSRSFFAHMIGPIAPGYTGTLKIPVDTGSQEAASVTCSVAATLMP